MITIKRIGMGSWELALIISLIAASLMAGYIISQGYMYCTNIDWRFTGLNFWTVLSSLLVGFTLAMLWILMKEKIIGWRNLTLPLLIMAAPIFITQIARLHYYLLLSDTADYLLTWRYWSIPILTTVCIVINADNTTNENTDETKPAKT